jgi:hypothetical protein
MLATQIAEPAGGAASRSSERKPELYRCAIVPCSRVRGRERWRIDKLQGNPRLGATIELLLRSEEGIEEVHANPVTGRVLVHFDPDSLSQPIETLIRRAIEFGPMSEEEFSTVRSCPPRLSLSGFVAAELGCSAIKLMLFGTCCPAVLAAAGVLFLFSRNVWPRDAARDRRRASRVVSDQPRRVEHN